MLLVQGKLQAAPLEVAEKRLAQKWEGFFELPDEDEDSSTGDDKDSAATKGRGRSLFKKFLKPRMGGQQRDVRLWLYYSTPLLYHHFMMLLSHRSPPFDWLLPPARPNFSLVAL